jgi:molecular chaperone DnaK
MMKDAEAHAEEDKRRRDEAEVRNSAEAQQFATEKFLADSGDKLPADKKAELETALEELKKTLEGADFEAIKAAQEKVSHVASEAGGAMYEAAQAAAGAEGAAAGSASGSESGSADDGVVDAEVVDEGTDGAEENK